MEKMYYKKHNCMVEVYNIICENHLMALIYSPATAGGQNGNGWMKVRAKDLIPEQYFDGAAGFISKSYKTRIKDRIKIVKSTLMTSDGEIFESMDEAFAHEETLYNNEKHINEATEE